ncbi:MAG: glycosyl transferase family 51 [Akkermansiaceae bacterium]|nr:glycosyl transferase family 51 [Akkermansiaceae bacterium]
MAKSATNTRNKLKKRRFYKRKGFWFTFIVVGILMAGLGYVAFDHFAEPYRQQAKEYDLERINDLEIPSVIFDRNDKEIGRVFVQNRSVIPISEVPDVFVNALRSGEDQRFWDHDGVDYVGIVRAFYLNWKSGRQNQGASTVTQQLARNAFNLKEEAKKRHQSDMERKLVEAFLAHRIELRYKKKEILEFYLNRIYFGSGFYGIRSASLGYFGKEPKDLTALESATIVGVIKSPNSLSPLNNPQASMKSRNLVIGRMPDLDGNIMTREEANRLMKEPLRTHPNPLQRGTTHLYERVADEIRSVMGEDALSAGGFKIHTSIDGRVQKALEDTLEQSYAKAERKPGYANQKRAAFHKTDGAIPEYLQGAALMVDHGTGEVIGYVGGRSYSDAPFDVIDSGRRPLGTAFFPFIYAAGLKQPNITPAMTMQDEQVDNRSVMVGGVKGILGEWGKETVNLPTRKPITVRKALEDSNVAATIRFAGVAGLDKVVKTASDFGFAMEHAELLPRIAVGWEAASMKEAVRGISAFARGGQTAPKQFTIVNRIDNADNRPVYERPRRAAERYEPIDEATAFQVHDMMRSGMENGSAAGLAEALVEKPFTGAGKTGTTHDFSDNWFLGYNGRVSCGVWLGFLQPGKSIYQGAFSKDLAMPVWIAGMNAASGDFGGKVIPQPASVEQVSICRVSGQRATPHCEELVTDPVTGRTRSRPSAHVEFYRTGTEANLPFCQIHSGASVEAPSSKDILLPSKIDTTPVRSKAPILLGDDPYHTEQVMAEVRTRPMNARGNVLDSFELGDEEKPVKLPWPKRLDINTSSD